MKSVAVVLGGLFLLMSGVAWAASSRKDLPAPAVEAPDQKPPTSAERTLMVKGQLLRDRWCPMNYAYVQAVIDVAKDEISGLYDYREAARKLHDIEGGPLHHDAENAKRDLDLFEIDVKTQYGGSFPSWWHYNVTDHCAPIQ